MIEERDLKYEEEPLKEISFDKSVSSIKKPSSFEDVPEPRDERIVSLQRELGLYSAVCLIISVMIGSGIFISPSSVLEKTGSVGLCLVVWALCGLISYLGALSFAELGTVVPHSGAEYAYFSAAFNPTHRYLGPLPAFIYIWVIVLVVRPAEVAILVLTFSEYICKPMEQYSHLTFSDSWEKVIIKSIALLALGLITYINFVSVKLYVRIQNGFSFLKILACVSVILGGIVYLCLGRTENLNKGFDNTNTGAKDLVLAFYNGLWAFDGWTSVTVVTEEIKNPSVNIPRSISIGVPLITILYFMMNISYMSVLSNKEMIAAQAVGMAFADKLFGPVAFLIPLAVALSTFGCALSVQFGVSRLCFAAGRQGHMIEALSYIHVRRFTPAPAVILQGCLCAIFIVTGSITQLIEFVSFLVWIFYGLAMLALIVMRRTKAKVKRPYKVPIIIPIFVALISIWLALVPLILSPALEYYGALVFILIGVLVYHILVYKRKHPKCMSKLTYLIQVLFEVIPAEEEPGL